MLAKRIFLIDERAADALPMRFTAASIVLLILVVLSATAVSSLLEEKRIHDCETAIQKIDSNAKLMSANGAGSRITMDIDVPKKTSIILGAIPDHEALWPADSNNYFIHTDNRDISGHSLASYSNESFSGPVSLGPGSHLLTLESIKRPTDNRIFVKVYEN